MLKSSPAIQRRINIAVSTISKYNKLPALIDEITANFGNVDIRNIFDLLKKARNGFDFGPDEILEGIKFILDKFGPMLLNATIALAIKYVGNEPVLRVLYSLVFLTSAFIAINTQGLPEFFVDQMKMNAFHKSNIDDEFHNYIKQFVTDVGKLIIKSGILTGFDSVSS